MAKASAARKGEPARHVHNPDVGISVEAAQIESVDVIDSSFYPDNTPVLFERWHVKVRTKPGDDGQESLTLHVATAYTRADADEIAANVRTFVRGKGSLLTLANGKKPDGAPANAW